MAIAELNIARLRYPLDDARMTEFVDNLGRVNAMAERMPGFIWRLVGDGSYYASVDLRPFADPMIIAGMSVWASVEQFEAFVFKTIHERFYRRKAEWFEPMTSPQLVIWPVPHGHLPTMDEGKARLAYLEAHGNSDYAFGWSHGRTH